LAATLVVLWLGLLAPAASQASFGIDSLEASAANEDGTIDLQAGSHPYGYTVHFEMNQDGEENPEGTIRSLIVELPPGLVGNPRAVPPCPGFLFDAQTPLCPGNTQVGTARVRVKGVGLVVSPVFNLPPSPGVPASVGFAFIGFNSFQEASLRTGGDYGVDVSDITFPKLEIQTVTETIWGVPAAESHDAERGQDAVEGKGPPVPTDYPLLPFLTLPTSCTGPLRTTVKVESLEEPGVFQTKSAESLGFGGVPAGLNGCARPAFEPTITAQPETTAADSPTGLHVNLHIPQNEAPEGIATAHLKDSVVTLPRGMVANPSVADGLGACAPAQIDLAGPGAARCPSSSKLGTVQIETPLLDHPVKGSVYLAQQGANPFNALIGLYIAVDDPITGVVVKLAGKVEPDPVTGQLSASFEDNPQLPFEDLDFDFFGGPRAALTTPATCGKYTTTTDLTPWTSPEGADAFPSDAFAISAGPGGGNCDGTESQMPNRPSFEAGTTTPIAGSYSPFTLRLSRQNGSQRIGAIDTTLPTGLLGRLSGTTYCSQAQLALARSRESLGQGAIERQTPSCPLSSEVGTVNVGAGSGAPYHVQGRAYLAGPYKGAPLSLAIITPALAGPFDLGNVVVRTALYVNESTAQIHAVSDPIPSILAGIPLDVRSIALSMDKPNFTLNPTSCAQKQITGSVTSTLGNLAPLQNRFQVGACGALGFKPKLSLMLKGGTKRSQHPALKAVLTYPKGSYANIAKAAVTLPASEFIDQAHVGNPCTRPVFAAEKCPRISVLGKAKVWTPLLDEPEEGKVYFRSNGGERDLPDVVIALKGQVPLTVVGFVDAKHQEGSEESRIRTTFASVPDAPVSRFVLELKGGKEGLLVNSGNLCKVPNRAVVRMTAHNGRTYDTRPGVSNDCGAKSKKSKGAER
jgi:hypothetical protein